MTTEEILAELKTLDEQLIDCRAQLKKAQENRDNYEDCIKAFEKVTTAITNHASEMYSQVENNSVLLNSLSKFRVRFCDQVKNLIYSKNYENALSDLEEATKKAKKESSHIIDEIKKRKESIHSIENRIEELRNLLSMGSVT